MRSKPERGTEFERASGAMVTVLKQFAGILLACWTAALTAFAADSSLTLAVGSGRAAPGEQVTVAVTVDSPREVAAAAFTVTFDPAALRFDSASSAFFEAFSARFPNAQPSVPVEVVVNGQTYQRPLAVAVGSSSGAVALAAARGAADSAVPELFELTFTVLRVGDHAVGLVPTSIDQGAAGYASATALPMLIGTTPGAATDTAAAWPALSVNATAGSIFGTFRSDDGDHLSDYWEIQTFGSTDRDGSEDFDGDTIPDGHEAILGTAPTALDSEGDGIPDQFELANALDPVKGDFDNGPDGDRDGDGFTNWEEFAGNAAANDEASAPKATHWALRLDVRVEDGDTRIAAAPIVLGNRGDGTDGFDDAIDERPAEGSNPVVFLRAAGDDTPLLRDLRDPADTDTWRLEIQADAGQTVTITPSEILPAFLTLTWTLADAGWTDTGEPVAIGQDGIVISNPGPDPLVRRILIAAAAPPDTSIVVSFTRFRWYLVSFPIQPTDARLGDLFADVAAAWRWDGERRRYLPANRIYPGEPIWLLLRADAVLQEVPGKPVPEPGVALRAGRWSLVGPIGTTPAPIPAGATAWLWDPVRQRYTQPAEDAAPGSAFWILPDTSFTLWEDR